MTCADAEARKVADFLRKMAEYNRALTPDQRLILSRAAELIESNAVKLRDKEQTIETIEFRIRQVLCEFAKIIRIVE